ncbi:MAG TPA: malonyl-ACP O-methyltransferase BioC [Gammaproteobacteria bacterium]|jgi:malonyl-CoA O-methyltransferase|nr:malonyl-ACP O-methyltransferase BioC [Gammaproteobacteria bacterium]
MNAADEFSLETDRVGASFDRAARDYDAAAFLQKEVSERLMERLDLTTLAPERVLDLGCGTGRPTRQLLKRYPKAEVIGVDLAPGMIAVAESHQPWFGKKARYLCAEASDVPLPDASCDLVYASLLLQWCEDLDRTLLEWRRLLKPHGLLLFSTLGPDTLKELRAAWSAVDGFNHVNRFLDMHDVGDALIRAGFVEPVMDVEHMVLTYEDARDLMRDLKAIGAHNVTAGRRRGLMGRGRLAAFGVAYEKFRHEGRLPATYEVVYGTAWAPKFMPTAALKGDAQGRANAAGGRKP